jgi:hypothetical protein
LSYELVAFGMPTARFDAVASAAEAATRANRLPHEPGTWVREANLKAPPCVV